MSYHAQFSEDAEREARPVHEWTHRTRVEVCRSREVPALAIMSALVILVAALVFFNCHIW